MRGYLRSGVTLIELLVSLALLSLLCSLLLPAVQSVRESARNATCKNNLRQITIASQNFEATHGLLPSNGWGYRWAPEPQRGVGRKQPGGWIYQLAGFCELNLPTSNGNGLNALHAKLDILRATSTVFSCPSRPKDILTLSNRGVTPYNAQYVAFTQSTDYAANEGDFITDTGAGPLTLSEGDAPGYRWTPTDRATGVIFLRSQVRFGDVTDGLSNTLLCGEKYASSDHYEDAMDPGNDQSMFSGVDLDINRWTLNPPRRDDRLASPRIFGSAHSSTCNLAFCDASVRSVSFNVAPEVFRLFGNRGDNRVPD